MISYLERESVAKGLRVLSADNFNQEIVSVEAYSAELISYLGEDDNKREDITKSFGRIFRFFDINNRDYAIIGLYDSGPYPTYPSNRITWDQLRNNDVYSLLRHEIGYQRFSHRIGYFVGKDGLLAVSEKRRSDSSMFSTLLKDYTYVIVNGKGKYRTISIPNGLRTRNRR